MSRELLIDAELRGVSIWLPKLLIDLELVYSLLLVMITHANSTGAGLAWGRGDSSAPPSNMQVQLVRMV